MMFVFYFVLLTLESTSSISCHFRDYTYMFINGVAFLLSLASHWSRICAKKFTGTEVMQLTI